MKSSIADSVTNLPCGDPLEDFRGGIDCLVDRSNRRPFQSVGSGCAGDEIAAKAAEVKASVSLFIAVRRLVCAGFVVPVPRCATRHAPDAASCGRFSIV